MKNNFSFKLDGVDAFSLPHSVFAETADNQTKTVYLFENGLKVTNIFTSYPKFNAFEWVNYFENTASSPSPIISDLYDCDYAVKMEKQSSRFPTAWRPETSDITMVYAPKGSDAVSTDFDCSVDDSTNGWWYGLFDGDSKSYSSTGGRSSDGTAPFFHIRRHDEGFIAGIGWTGQWKRYGNSRK